MTTIKLTSKGVIALEGPASSGGGPYWVPAETEGEREGDGVQ